MQNKRVCQLLNWLEGCVSCAEIVAVNKLARRVVMRQMQTFASYVHRTGILVIDKWQPHILTHTEKGTKDIFEKVF